MSLTAWLPRNILYGSDIFKSPDFGVRGPVAAVYGYVTPRPSMYRKEEQYLTSILVLLTIFQAGVWATRARWDREASSCSDSDVVFTD